VRVPAPDSPTILMDSAVTKHKKGVTFQHIQQAQLTAFCQCRWRSLNTDAGAAFKGITA
jgi:hypothetical protein